MKQIPLLLAGAAVLVCAGTSPKLNYPPAPRSEQVDDYHGTKIADPYRTLENADSPATQKWVEQENELTFSYLAKLPGRVRPTEWASWCCWPRPPTMASSGASR